MRKYLQLIRNNPGFARLWFSQVISLTGDWFNTIVLSTLVAQYSNGSGVAVSLFLLARFLPSFIFTPFAGVLVDRYNRKQVLIWSNLLRALIVPLFLLANSPDRLWLIYVVTIIQFILSTVFEPGQSAIIPALTQEKDLVEANTLVSITWSVMLAIGAVLGGAFAAVFGAQIALLTDAVTFAIAAALIATIHYKPKGKPKLESQDAEDTSFMEGIRYASRHPQMAAALSIKTTSFIGNFDTIMTVLATQIFIIGATGELSLGIMFSMFGIGAVIGPMLTNIINDGSVHQMRRLVLLGFIIITISWGILAWGVNIAFLLVCAAIFIRALGGSVNWTYSTIIIQKTAPDAYLGRMFSIDMAGFQLATVVSTLAHGWLIDWAGAEHIGWIALGSGVVSILPLIFWAWILPRLEHQDSLEIQETSTVVTESSAD